MSVIMTALDLPPQDPAQGHRALLELEEASMGWEGLGHGEGLCDLLRCRLQVQPRTPACQVHTGSRGLSHREAA
jgi:hypothetical protein